MVLYLEENNLTSVSIHISRRKNLLLIRVYVIVEQSVLSNLGDIPFSTIGYPWVTQKQWKAALLSPSDIKNYLLETLMLNLIFLIHPSLQIFCKIQTGAFSISRFLVKSLVNKNCLTRELVLMLIWNLDWFLNFMKKNSLTLKKMTKMSF